MDSNLLARALDNITETTVITDFNVLDYTADLTGDNRSVVINGTLENPALPGQLIVEISTDNATAPLSVYDILIVPELSATHVYPVTWDGSSFDVTLQSNSTITKFAFSQPEKSLTVNVRVPFNLAGFCNVTIPTESLGGPYFVYLDGVQITPVETSNATHTSLYITYTQNSQIDLASRENQDAKPFPIGIVAIVVVISVAGAAALFIYFSKVKKASSVR